MLNTTTNELRFDVEPALSVDTPKSQFSDSSAQLEKPIKNILIAEYDLYSSLGGGQTFYRKMIELHPEINFYYLQKSKKETLFRPSNAHPLKFDWKYRPRNFFANQTTRLGSVVVEALNIANAAAGRNYDAVDVPDYHQTPLFLREAFKKLNVKVDKIVLSLHGTISTSIETNFGGHVVPKTELNDIKFIERLQFEAADIRYGISPFYISEWREKTGITAEYLDPIHVINPSKITNHKITDEQPEILFIGRSDKRKGPEIAVDLVSALPNHLKRKLVFVGPKVTTYEGWTSERLLLTYAKNRNVEVEFTGGLTPEQLAKRISGSTIVLAPSRYDSLNLTCLESLFSGSPTLIGNGAGACEYLDSKYPNVPYIKVDVSDYFSALPALVDLIENFSERKKELIEAVNQQKTDLTANPLVPIYQSKSTKIDSAEDVVKSQFKDICEVQEVFKFFSLGYAMFKLKSLVKAILFQSRKIRNSKEQIRFVKKLGLQRVFKVFVLKVLAFLRLWNASVVLGRFAKGLTVTSKQVRNGMINVGRFGRAKLYLRRAFIEERLGNFAIASAYISRVLRWTDSNDTNLIEKAKAWTNAGEFKGESFVLDLLHKSDPARDEKIFDYISNRPTQLLNNPKVDFETVIDRRNNEVIPSISVIVSMYAASKKLPSFLKHLSRQTHLLDDQNSIELILVDSGSPRGGEEVKEIEQSIKDHFSKYQVLICRTKTRETIQAAWNRGLSVARGEFVTFLGADETLKPDALKILNAELKNNLDVDWVMGNSVVTNVTTNGEWVEDIMIYNRTGLVKHSHILECCYYSYVGGLYRKNIHDRVGYYDDTFKAAGDTEFKNRASPFINIKHVPLTLGIFLNYPEERTTQHPRAEIEDRRAWYLFRTTGGLKYYTQGYSADDLYQFFVDCLGYRKSYCGHTSVDLDLAQILIERPEVKLKLGAIAEPLKNTIVAARKSLIEIDSNVGFNFSSLVCIFKCIYNFKKLAKLGHKINAKMLWTDIYHDNRYEQHSNIW